MKQFLEKVSILSLSLVLITSFSISSALPAMFDYYQGYSTGQVELLVSLPSFGIMGMLLLNGVLERVFPERLQLTFYPSVERHLSGIRVITLSLRHACYLGLELGCSMPRPSRSSVNVTTAKLVFRCLVFVALLKS